MAQVPGEGHPDRWLYEQLQEIRLSCLWLLLVSVAISRPTSNPSPKAFLEESRQKAARRFRRVGPPGNPR